MEILSSIGGLLGGLFSSKKADKINQQNLAAQKEAAQNQVQWRVADAKKAGVGTLTALGMNPVSISPSTVSGPDFSDIGQNIGRAADAAVSKVNQALNTEILAGQRDKIQLENDLIKRSIAASDIMLRSQAGAAKGIPSPNVPMAVNPEKKADPVTFAGVEVERSPFMSDAQDATNRWGETIGDFIIGPMTAIEDARWNYQNLANYGAKYFRRRLDQWKANRNMRGGAW